MENSPDSPKDLSSLINEAEKQIDHRDQTVARVSRPRKKLPLGYILAGLLWAVIAFMGFKLWQQIRPPAEQQIEQDLDAVIEQAHAAIETAKADTGELPDALPDAALASVVGYEHDREGYKLTATIMGIRVTLERDGKKTTERGVE